MDLKSIKPKLPKAKTLTLIGKIGFYAFISVVTIINAKEPISKALSPIGNLIESHQKAQAQKIIANVDIKIDSSKIAITRHIDNKFTELDKKYIRLERANENQRKVFRTFLIYFEHDSKRLNQYFDMLDNQESNIEKKNLKPIAQVSN